ncbi:MAG: hypothetical protein HOP19_27975 [Acidobacteria bacterium]|nr:hypothetical protein [Acidobacteriota bacterium]
MGSRISSSVFLLMLYVSVFATSAFGNEAYLMTTTFTYPANNMVGSSYAYLSYTAEVYYCINMTANLIERVDDEVTGGPGMHSIGDCMDSVDVYDQWPYNPSAEYEMQSEISVQPYFWSDTSQYWDYYNFQVYDAGGGGDPVWYPLDYNFIGNGPQSPSLSNIVLGTVYSVWALGGQAGRPHHLKVITDETATASCGSKRRLITFQVVDVSGRHTGLTPTVETLHAIPEGTEYCPWNSCKNQGYCPPSCSTDGPTGKFIDQLWVGCPSSGGSCGFDDTRSKWWWCPRGRPRVLLTNNIYHVKHDSVLVNSLSDIVDGTHLYP